MLPETREIYELEKLWTLRSYDDQLAQILPESLPDDFIIGLTPEQQWLVSQVGERTGLHTPHRGDLGVSSWEMQQEDRTEASIGDLGGKQTHTEYSSSEYKKGNLVYVLQKAYVVGIKQRLTFESLVIIPHPTPESGSFLPVAAGGTKVGWSTTLLATGESLSERYFG